MRKVFAAGELEGQKLGKLLVLELKQNRTPCAPYEYLCLCDCGIRVTRTRSSLMTNHAHSCGCSRRPLGPESPYWTGYMDISGLWWAHVRSQADSRDFPFTLSIKRAWAIFEEQNRTCALSGRPLHMGDRKNKNRTASLDRIDSKLGYVEGNIQWVHKDFNKMKWDMSMSNFLKACAAVVARRGHTCL